MITVKQIEDLLFEKQDLTYRKFQAKLMPNVDIENIIGVRTPEIKAIANQIWKDENIDCFLKSLPHKYYDEYNLHGFIISKFNDYTYQVQLVDELLPYVDNWATCDLLSPKSFKKHKDLLKNDILRWISSNKTFTIRFGIEMVMSHFLDEDFDKELMLKISTVKSEEYYVNMMIAWYFSTALAKKWQDTLPFIENKTLSPWVHNKTIQKAIESYRITDEQKKYLKSLKI